MVAEAIWAVERRRLGDEQPHSWRTAAYATNREQAEHHYHRHLLYMQGHEMRLLEPGGGVVRHHRDIPMAAPNVHADWRTAAMEVLP